MVALSKNNRGSVNPMEDPEQSCYNTALKLASLGYHVIPVVPKSKQAALEKWQDMRLGPDDVLNHWAPQSALGVGMLLSTKVAEDVYVIGIDIDTEDPMLMHNILKAFVAPPPGKRGKKGATFFVRQPHPNKKRILKRQDPVTKQRISLVELLAAGQQTVMPPSVHPDGMEYRWLNQPLTEVHPQALPELSANIFAEIQLAVVNPDSALFKINQLNWLGENGGGNTHDNVLAAIGAMVQLGWADDYIWDRVDRETRDAVLTFGDDYNWPGWEKEVRSMIQTAKEKGFAEKPKKEKVQKIVARWFMQDFVGPERIYHRDGRVAIYKDGAFDLIDHAEVRHLIATKYPEPGGVSLQSPDWQVVSNNVLDMSPRFPDQRPKHRVCLVNGTWDMEAQALGSHSREDFLISRLGFEHDKHAECPIYEKFLARTFDQAKPDDTEKCINTYEEFIAHTLFECLDYHKFLVLKGTTRTGKSTLTKVARMLHGPNAVSAVPVHEFGNERYRTAMVGRLLNIVNEVASTSHVADDFLKAVTSGDEVQVRYLYNEPQLVRLPTRLVIACNEMFRVRDTSGAIEARMIILTCDNRVPDAEQDHKLEFKLQAEMPGIFNRMCKAWVRLQERGYFDPPLKSDDDIATFTADNNHVIDWVREKTLQGMAMVDGRELEKDRDKPTDVGHLYLDYAEWAKMNGYKSISSSTFGQRLSNLHLPNRDLKPQIIWLGNRSVRVRNLTLTTETRY